MLHVNHIHPDVYQDGLTTIGSRIRPMKFFGIEYRSAVSSMDATTKAPVRKISFLSHMKKLTIISAERSYYSYAKETVALVNAVDP